MSDKAANGVGFRQQIIMSLVLMPVMFGIWYAAGELLAGPAVWLAGVILTQCLPGIVSDTSLNEGLMIVFTQFGELNGAILPAAQAGHEMAIQLNPRLVSYSIPFYAALLWASRLHNPFERFAVGLFVLWLAMALGLVAVAAKDFMLVIGGPFLEAPWVPYVNVIGVAYQFSVLLVPSLAPVVVWLWQLRGTPLWQELEAQLARR